MGHEVAAFAEMGKTDTMLIMVRMDRINAIVFFMLISPDFLVLFFQGTVIVRGFAFG